MSETFQHFSFIDAGRTFDCRVEASRPGAGDRWWWFAVSTEPFQRHAPFRAGVTDTIDGIRARVVAYHDQLLARRAEPARGWWGGRPRPVVAATPAPLPTPLP